MFCYDEFSLAIFETLQFGFFSTEVPVLIYYSHLTAIIGALALSIFIFSNNKTLPARILVVIALLFSTLAVIDIFLWTLIDARWLMFLWSFWLFLFITIYALSFYFLYTFITKKNLAFHYQLGGVLVLATVLLISVSRFNLGAFDVGNCSAVEGIWALNAVFGLSFLIFLTSIVFGIVMIRRTTDPAKKRQAALATTGIALFLFAFSASAYIASVANFFGRAPDTFTIEQYGYFGMTAFIGFLTYIVVKYRAFNIKLIAAQAIVTALVFLIASQFFFIRSTVNIVLNSITLMLAVTFGYFLVRSVHREIAQRERLEELTTQLSAANERLKILDKMKSEFVSIASHQLRSPLTAIRGYASMLLEGSFGKMPQKATEAVQRIAESSRYMALSVEDYLNVSRIEAGNMKYELAEFNLKNEIEKVIDEVRPTALKKGLMLSYKTKCTSGCTVKADIGKIRQVVLNLIDNSMKYTEKGSIDVLVHDDVKKKRMAVSITDTGVGMSEATIEALFEKFVRAKNANSVNVTGTGLGLYVAKRMVEEMGGKVWAESPGEGKGSTFHVELPLAK